MKKLKTTAKRDVMYTTDELLNLHIKEKVVFRKIKSDVKRCKCKKIQWSNSAHKKLSEMNKEYFIASLGYKKIIEDIQSTWILKMVIQEESISRVQISNFVFSETKIITNVINKREIKTTDEILDIVFNHNKTPKQFLGRKRGAWAQHKLRFLRSKNVEYYTRDNNGISEKIKENILVTLGYKKHTNKIQAKWIKVVTK